MAISKVVYGQKTLIDLTGDTVTPETLAIGAIAHDATGMEIVGTMKTREVGYQASDTSPEDTELLWIDTANDNTIKFYDSSSETWLSTSAIAIWG